MDASKKILVEDIQIGDTVFKDDNFFFVTDIYEGDGEGRGFITTNEAGKERKFTATCGTYLIIKPK